jgi:hypothetical protein
MNKLQFRLLAVCAWLGALACGIAYLGMREAYVNLADGTRVTATVVKVEVHDDWYRADLEYIDPVGRYGKEKGGREEFYDTGTGTPPAVGATMPIVLDERAAFPHHVSEIEEERPSIFLPLGAVACLGLGVWLWLAPRRAAKVRAARTGPMDVVYESLARTRNVSYGLAVFLVLAGGFMVLVAFADPDAKVGVMAFILVLAALCLGLAGFSLRQGYRLRDPRHNHVVDLLERRTHDLAWFHIREVRSRGVSVEDVMLWGANGKLAGAIRLVPEDRDALLDEIARRAPHAAQGYSIELQQQYKAQPDRWRPRAT